MGQFDKAISEARLGLDLSPDNVAAVYTLMIAYIRMKRLNEAKKVYEEARARKLDSPFCISGVTWWPSWSGTMPPCCEFVESAKGKPLTGRSYVDGRVPRIEAYTGGSSKHAS